MSRNYGSTQTQKTRFVLRENLQTPYITNPFGKYASQFTKTIKAPKIVPHSRADGPLTRSQCSNRSPSRQRMFLTSSSRQESLENSNFQRSFSRTNSAPRSLRPPTHKSYSIVKKSSYQRSPSPTTR
ncbi:unnamed protein product [Blepharisma stoltei]|uniref:Uncharacterized protein n=1 Tax=Blepharisma stoltei TaxID=1481888 RepID=A0AAU9KAT7_9CILI|nr:unnamed protein product [Blepharisma stoltei]